MTRTPSAGFNTALRIPIPLLERIDGFGRRLASQRPGEEVTRSEAIRILITRALDAEVENACKVPYPQTLGSAP